MLRDPTTLFYLSSAVVGFAVLTAVLARWPRVGAALMLVGWLPDLLFSTVSGRLLGFQIQPLDVLCASALLVACARVVSGPRVPRGRLLIAVALLSLVQLAAGVVQFGANHAINEYREYLYFFVAAVYNVVVFTSRDRTYFFRLLYVTGWVVFALCLLGWAHFGIQASTSEALNNPTRLTERAIPADGAMLLIICAATTWLGLRRPKPAALFLVAALLVQHRTVWLAFAVCVLVVLFQVRHANARAWAAAGAAGFLAFAATFSAIALGVGGHVLATLSTSFTSIFAENSTASWRFAQWDALLHQEHGNVFDWLLGRPFGTGYDRIVAGVLLTISPHNFYVESVLRIGYLGTVALILVYVRIFLRARRAGDLLPQILTAGSLTYFIAYAPGAGLGFTLGLAALLTSIPDASAPAAATPPTAAKIALA